jgi:hypothetical protein
MVFPEDSISLNSRRWLFDEEIYLEDETTRVSKDEALNGARDTAITGTSRSFEKVNAALREIDHRRMRISVSYASTIFRSVASASICSKKERECVCMRARARARVCVCVDRCVRA